MKPYHQMTRRELVEYLQGIFRSLPKANWDKLKIGDIVICKVGGWSITRVPPKRGFIWGKSLLDDSEDKLLRSKYDGELLLTDLKTVNILRTVHREELKKALAQGIEVPPIVQYDYPELFSPYPANWDEKKVQRAEDWWNRVNDMRYFYDRNEGPGWPVRRIDTMIQQSYEEIAQQQEYRKKVEQGYQIKKPESIPGIVARIDVRIAEIEEDIEILRHLKKHAQKVA